MTIIAHACLLQQSLHLDQIHGDCPHDVLVDIISKQMFTSIPSSILYL